MRTALLLCALTIGCEGGSGSDPDEPVAEDFVGTWRLELGAIAGDGCTPQILEGYLEIVAAGAGLVAYNSGLPDYQMPLEMTGRIAKLGSPYCAVVEDKDVCTHVFVLSLPEPIDPGGDEGGGGGGDDDDGTVSDPGSGSNDTTSSLDWAGQQGWLNGDGESLTCEFEARGSADRIAP